jgi:hypothetical protein
MSESQRVYEQVRAFVSRRTIAHATQRAIRESELKTSLCANGSLDPEAVDTAFRKLAQDDVILRGDGWVTIDAEDADWYRQVIEDCAAREDPPRELIGACNRRLADE